MKCLGALGREQKGKGERVKGDRCHRFLLLSEEDDVASFSPLSRHCTHNNLPPNNELRGNRPCGTRSKEQTEGEREETVTDGVYIHNSPFSFAQSTPLQPLWFLLLLSRKNLDGSGAVVDKINAHGIKISCVCVSSFRV